ncbi:MAG TPA: hypothetical protein VE868_06545, partial [Balneolaceae bacterium]|nr:hypothetical protein [Balneolaceae bacterium]
GERTRVDFNLDCRTFYGEPEEDLAQFIQALPAQLKKDLERFKEEAENSTFKQKAEDTVKAAEKARAEKIAKKEEQENTEEAQEEDEEVTV